MTFFAKHSVFIMVCAAMWRQAFGDEDAGGADYSNVVGLMDEMDTDEDKHLSLEEIRAGFDENGEHRQEGELQFIYDSLETVFNKTDKNADGVLSIPELREFDAIFREKVHEFRDDL
eukprot:TRINITY_DN19919_c0_g1_i1.p2 TRINITY_DN19919_c0_g1~~TRINITY_DN19919_c0_g1_i1.p2  ORF type:complete len:117 (-),score=32.04 TRINITY_DN19919_c0_g1_i1:50-400(-)